MWFWWFMFVSNLVYPLIMIIGGWFMWKRCPQKMHSYVGYRTKRSKLNIDTWKFANENCGKRWWKIGWIMLLPTALVQIPFWGKDEDTIGSLGLAICIVECTILLVSVIPTDKALKETFNDDGIRR